MKISVVLTTHNRNQQLQNTLWSINQSSAVKDTEVIIVDDYDTPFNFENEIYKFKLKYIHIPPEQKWWANPCINFNIGFKNIDYKDLIIIQNAECLHLGDILSTANNIKDNEYYSFACYSISEEITNKLFLLKDNFNFENIINCINPIHYHGFGPNMWYNHSIINPRALHFLSAIKYKDLEELNGFDERYAQGIEYDDNEFLERIKRKKMQIKFIDNPFCIHQFHKSINYKPNKKGEYINNQSLFLNTTMKESIIKVNV